ncbi:Nramp-domain-containing protein [Dichomitus squalens LYAD-421 SS1]|uniref:Nramp-domain-containing protein n=1 Tax=Dichomitus squalens (strain LYAD-421) TaxID=732165 RepID=UPI0004412344|nr:Nramp-domain-containing protein [Dichomitus squalens LYAD-421 SS1]EJF67328.1 Nramp-domain-containing protein [Dichomitus squalens LYAD-421 SS1]
MQETTSDLELAAREPERQDVTLDNPPAVAPPALLPQQAQKGGCAAWWHHTKKYAWIVVRHTTKHTGVGIVCAVAYFDPGNWGVDLQAGSEYGYKLLFVVLLAGIFAIVFQTQASRLGCVTGMDLASHCRLLLYDRPKHKLLWRWLALYPLYALSEIAIVSTDLAELLGSAIALCLLFPKLPLWAGVLITASDVLFLLALRDPIRGQPVRLFELSIAILVSVVLICMAIIISKARVHWEDAFDGFLPSKTLFQSGALYTSIGIIGATVMPHSLFLGSALATQDRMSIREATSMADVRITVDSTDSMVSETTTLSDSRAPSPQSAKHDMRCCFRSFAAAARRHLRLVQIDGHPDEPKSHAERENNPYYFVRAHLYHGIVDMVISLLGLAVVINALILTLSSAVFFDGRNGSRTPASLFDAYALLQDELGKGIAIMFALALLASGQSASIIATLAGQIVSEGFIRWKVSPIMRRFLTRCLGLIPALLVAAAAGRPGIDTLLVASQVVLSIVLPFIVFPLLWFTSSKSIMSVKKPLERVASQDTSTQGALSTQDPMSVEAQVAMVDFSNGKVMVVVSYAIWLVIVIANVYAIVGLAMGQGG